MPIRQRYFSTDDQRTTDASKAGAQTFFARTEKGPMRRCAQCHGRLGLGVRFRNLWSGHGWVHLRFCSTRCEGIFKQDREEANAKRRWYTVLFEDLTLCHAVRNVIEQISGPKITPRLEG